MVKLPWLLKRLLGTVFGPKLRPATSPPSQSKGWVYEQSMKFVFLSQYLFIQPLSLLKISNSIPCLI